MLKMKNIKWVFVSVFIWFLVGCGNSYPNIEIESEKNDNMKILSIFTSSLIMFTIDKEKGKVKFLEEYKYGRRYFADEKEWLGNIQRYKNHPTEILGCIEILEYQQYERNKVYKNCSERDGIKLKVSKEDVKKILYKLRYSVNKEFNNAGYDVLRLEKLLERFHSTPTDDDILLHKLVHRLESIYKSKKTASNYFKLHNLIYNYPSAFYSTSAADGPNNKIKYYKKLQHDSLIKAFNLSKNKREKLLIKNTALSYSSYTGFFKFVGSSHDVTTYKKFLKHFGLTPNQKIVRESSEVYYYLDSKNGKLDIDTIEKLLSSNYYKDILIHKTPTVSTGYSNSKYYFKLNYNVSNKKSSYKYTFEPVCKYIKTTNKVEDLGFFEVFGTGGMAESKNVTYKVYSCNLKKSDIRKIKYLEQQLNINEFSKILNKAPWIKYEVIGKTYNRSTYKAPVSTNSSNTSTQKISSNKGCVYKSGYVVCDGRKVGSVWCGINCTANCLKGYIYGSSDDRFGDKDRAIQGIISRCKK